MKGLYCMFEGTIAKPPVRTLSRNNVPWTRLKCDVRVRDEETNIGRSMWVAVSVPGAQGEQWLYLQVGDRVRVEGHLELSSYEKDGRPQIGLTILPTLIRLLEPADGGLVNAAH